jgi:XTP/dITP diphosphohydrolase
LSVAASERAVVPLVLASANPAKAAELRALLNGLPFRILDVGDFPGLALPAEDELSYSDNALAKARSVAAATGHLALGDDSGLEVDALGGAPGVSSARYGGPGLDDAGRCRALLRALAGVPPGRRSARFRCVVALAGPGGREATVEGVAEGLILQAPRGAGGFGYDPLFLYPPLAATFAELPSGAKHRVSHRGRALARAREALRAWHGAATGSCP